MTAHVDPRLSEQQEAILLHVFKQQVVVRGLDGRSPFPMNFAIWGAPWGACMSHSRSEHASVSRALHRLEQRGLVLRQNWANGPLRKSSADPHVRTTNVLILQAGVNLALRLTKRSGEKC